MIHHLRTQEELLQVLHESINGRRALVLTDSNTHGLCWPVIGQLDALAHADILEIEPGEESKCLDISQQLWHAMLEMDVDRHALLINLGGGVVTDLGGFIAATFKRGISFIHIPTSLLAMTDASLGGKTGINLGHSKNQVGTFSQAEDVLIHPGFLNTLPKRELISGFAEMIKHGLLGDVEYFTRLSTLTSIDTTSIESYIERSAEIKMDIVAKDVRESGLRKSLNLGHTIGHALEGTLLGTDGEITHGEAVAWGMVCEAEIARSAGILPESDQKHIEDLIYKWYQPPLITEALLPDILEALKSDKKNTGNSVRMVLPEEIGKVRIDVEVSEKESEAAIRKCLMP